MDSIGKILKEIWSDSHAELLKAVSFGSWGAAAMWQGELAGIVKVAKGLGYDVEIKQRDKGKENVQGASSGASSEPVPRKSPAKKRTSNK